MAWLWLVLYFVNQQLLVLGLLGQVVVCPVFGGSGVVGPSVGGFAVVENSLSHRIRYSFDST